MRVRAQSCKFNIASTQDLTTSAIKPRGNIVLLDGRAGKALQTVNIQTAIKRFPVKEKEMLNMWAAFVRRHRA